MSVSGSHYSAVEINQAFESSLRGILLPDVGEVLRAVPTIAHSDAPGIKNTVDTCLEFADCYYEDQPVLELRRQAFTKTLRSYVYSGLAISTATVQMLRTNCENICYSAESLSMLIFPCGETFHKTGIKDKKEMRAARIIGKSAMRQLEGRGPKGPSFLDRLR